MRDARAVIHCAGAVRGATREQFEATNADGVARLVRAAVDFVKDCGAEPIILPAMGSHGGATAEGQVAVLEGYGITEKSVDAPILSSM